MRPKVVAVLSGGGAKGAAHVGAMKALEEWDLVPDHIVGTSMGAVIGACFACGLRYEEVLQRITAVGRRDVASFSPSAVLGVLSRSLLQPEPFRETLSALVPATRFADLETPLTVTAVDAKSGDLVLFGAGGRSHIPLQDALYASCALPVYYPAGVIGDREYIDGGVRAVLPLDVALRFDPALVVGVSVGPSLYAPQSSNGMLASGVIGAHRRALRIMMAIQTEQVVSRWRQDRPTDFILIQPHIEGGATFDVENVVDFVQEGYRASFRELSVWHGQS